MMKAGAYQCAFKLVLSTCAALLLMAGGASAATDYYVAPAGPGGGGTNWATAFSNAQDAATLATNAGDKIYLQCGVYSNASQLVISNAAGLTVYGGCVGNGTNAYSGTNSTLTKTGGEMRIVCGSVSTVALVNVTISGGYFSSGTNHGAGLFFTNCAATLTNCVVRDNTNVCSSSWAAAYGGGIFAAGGSLTLVDSAFYNNALRSTVHYVYGYGGGIAAVNCPLTVRGSGSVFSNNSVSGIGTYAFPYGGAIFTTNSALTLEDATLIRNYAFCADGGGFPAYGGAVYHVGSGMSATFTGCRFATNSVTSGDAVYGGAVYLGGATGVIANCVFTNNYFSGGGPGNGVGVYASGLQSLQVVSNVFQGNWPNAGVVGGMFHVTSCVTTVVDHCLFDGSGLLAGTAPNLVYVTGVGRTLLLNSTLQNNSAGRGLNFAGGTASSLAMTNCLIQGNNGNGLTFVGGAGSTLGLTNCVMMGNNGNGLTFTNGNAALLNCLMARNIQDGLGLAAGTVTVANCTLAENGGWGLNRAGGTGMVVNSIAWGNGSGGILSNANVWVDYSCLQTPASGGDSNIISDPLFVSVAGCYYLSVIGLTGQTASSPCIDAGSNMPAFWGLDTRTTRTDGTNDTNTVVDLGYHYTNGVPDSSILTVTNCYVDAVGGNDASNGLAWASAWRSITHALTNVAANATINVAAGTYSAGQTAEIFPLTVQMPGLTLAASNANPALTVVDNAGTNGQRVLQALCKGTVVLKGLTFRGGRFGSGENYGAGLLFQGCAITLTNCVVRDNTNVCTTASYGGGVYAVGGSLAIFDTAFYNNAMQCAASVNVYGGGIAAVNCPLSVRGSGSVFSNNSVSASSGFAIPYGGAVYASGAALTLEDATLIRNCVVSGMGGGYPACGGAVYHTGSGMSATITGCRFATNSANSGDAVYGGAVYLGGATGVITNCVFTNNYFGGGGPGNGGGVYASGLQSLQAVSNVFQGNRLDSVGVGGTFHVASCATTVVDHCSFDGRGLLAGTAPDLVYVTGAGRAWFLNSTLQNNRAGRGLNFAGGAASSLAMTNCLVVNNGSNGLYLAAGTATVVNCTLANNVGWGIARPTSAGLTMKNSILWGNTLGGIGHNQNLTLTFTDSQDAWAAGLGAGNFSADPLFVDAAGGDYHEQGVEGSYHGGGWTSDARNSPCLDAGDPTSDWSLEPKPCGNRINAGAYGNTAEATRSLPKVGTVLRIY